jgi:hypothetical protein
MPTMYVTYYHLTKHAFQTHYPTYTLIQHTSETTTPLPTHNHNRKTAQTKKEVFFKTFSVVGKFMAPTPTQRTKKRHNKNFLLSINNHQQINKKEVIRLHRTHAQFCRGPS